MSESSWQGIPIQKDSGAIKFRIQEGDRVLSMQRFLKLLEHSQDFQRFYSNLLAEMPWEAFRWENRPYQNRNLDEPYEFVALRSDLLTRLKPDPSAFTPYFRDDVPVVDFSNLGKNARLIVPCPVTDHGAYTHISEFVRKAPQEQQDALWSLVGKIAREEAGISARWLSTAGMGVSWLHVRIEQMPKYFRTQEYKEA